MKTDRNHPLSALEIYFSGVLRTPGFLLAAILAGLTLTATCHPKAQRPNLVFIIADDCTYLDMEVYGGQAKTPHLKKLAEEGLKFTRCFQTAPMCSPTRHNLYTGLYPVKSGAWPNHTRVYEGTRSVAHYLKDAGYTVHLSGKTHIAPRSSFPFEYSNEFKTADPREKDCYPTIEKLFAAASPAEEEPRPFCLFACSNEPHSPFTKGDPSAYPPASLKLPPSWVDTAATRKHYSKYLAEITYYDQQCGKLFDLLEEYGLKDNTLVMVVSEQGSQFPFAKWTCYEMGLASAMIARWPGKTAAGTTTDALVEYVDITPTFLDGVGTKIPSSLDGRSFLPVLLGQREEHKQFTYGLQTTRGIANGSEYYGIRSCATKTHRYIRNLNHNATFQNVIIKPRQPKADDFWQSWVGQAENGNAHARQMVRRFQHRPEEELYNVRKDPHCLHNLADDPAMAETKAMLSAELDRWMKSQGDTGRDIEATARTRQGHGGKKRKPSR